MIELIHGDCLIEMTKMPENSVDSIVTDPPYGLSFMGKKWDYEVPSVDIWKEAFRVLKPGGFLLAFAGTKTQHRMCVNIEDAGFEIRDMIAWIYGSGFPKSLNIGKSIDKELGVERQILGIEKGASSKNTNSLGEFNSTYDETKPETDEAKEWDGWGTALKPCMEPITVARKPLSENTVALNVMKHGTAGINIDGCRIETDELENKVYKNKGDNLSFGGTYGKGEVKGNPKGRWPGNVIHDGSNEVEALFPEQSSRFFYTAKASKSDRDEGLRGCKTKQRDESRKEGNPGGDNPRNRGVNERKNFHPTVKPTDLMKYLCRLVTPKQGTVLDPFMGSGSTGRAAKLEHFNFIGIEVDKEYFEIAEKRIASINAIQNEIEWVE